MRATAPSRNALPRNETGSSTEIPKMNPVSNCATPADIARPTIAPVPVNEIA